MQTEIYSSLKTTTTSTTKKDDCLVVEAALQININNSAYTVVMRTPGNDLELIRGLLYAEDIYKNDTNFNVDIIKKSNAIAAIVNVNIPPEKLGKGYLNKRTLLSVSSCGICGKKELKDIAMSGDKITQKHSYTAAEIHHMFVTFNKHQHTFKKTGGSHAAALFTKNYKLLTLQEDIGRHNAVDKCIGALLNTKTLKKASFLLVSGRVSYEIVSKAFIAKIPIIVAVSACSSLAVDFAKEFGMCLIGFTRPHKMTIYANPNILKN